MDYTKVLNINAEIHELTKHKEATVKQWEESLSAMSNRDKTIQSIANIKEKVETKLHEVSVVNRAVKSDHNAAIKALSKRDQGNMN